MRVKDPEGLAVFNFMKYKAMFRKHMDDYDWEDIKQIGWLCCIKNNYKMIESIRDIQKETNKYIKNKGFLITKKGEKRRNKKVIKKGRYTVIQKFVPINPYHIHDMNFLTKIMGNGIIYQAKIKERRSE